MFGNASIPRDLTKSLLCCTSNWAKITPALEGSMEIFVNFGERPLQARHQGAKNFITTRESGFEARNEVYSSGFVNLVIGTGMYSSVAVGSVGGSVGGSVEGSVGGMAGGISFEV